MSFPYLSDHCQSSPHLPGSRRRGRDERADPAWGPDHGGQRPRRGRGHARGGRGRLEDGLRRGQAEAQAVQEDQLRRLQYRDNGMGKVALIPCREGDLRAF